ncbi:uncharacterized protein LOC126700359 [Quercus robur]|uniref:uncharacterized protein LOC126700359 n=1 Tax=Quercus robur TaxID=38942 RepID=UPI00216158EC|nr:uncharacterized protein LOC126700359 [Quercus robur]
MLWLKGENGDVELRSPEGKFGGKVIIEITEAMKMCKKEAEEATKILNDPEAEEMQALHDLLTLDRLLKYENVSRHLEVGYGIRRQIKPQIGGTGVLTWNDILSSFSEDEKKELKEVLMTEDVQEESIDEENSSDSLDNSLFLDKAFTDLKQKLGSGPKQLMDLWNREKKVVNVRDYLVPQSLAPILESLFEKYGDVGAETNLSSRVKMYLIVILCGTIDSVCCTRILDITEDKLLNWMQYLRALEYAGFKIQFVHDQWMRVTKAYFGLQLRKLEDDTLQELETDITKYDAKVKELTTKLELMKDKHKRITSEKSGKRSSLIEDCLRAAAKLKWKKAGAGLIKLG